MAEMLAIDSGVLVSNIAALTISGSKGRESEPHRDEGIVCLRAAAIADKGFPNTHVFPFGRCGVMPCLRNQLQIQRTARRSHISQRDSSRESSRRY